MSKYGWYIDGEEQVRSTGDDVVELIQAAVKEFTAAEEIVAEERGDSEDELKHSINNFLGMMRVGEMKQLSASYLIDESDILEADEDFSGPLTGHDVCEMVNCKLNDEMGEGSACIKSDSQEFPTRVIGDPRAFAEAAMAWAKENISFDPPFICKGRNPIPMCLVNGQWIWGDKQHEDADVQAYIVYTTQPSPETGHEGWVWWALGRMGDANTLQDAMAQAEAKLAQIAAKEAGQ